MRYTIPATDISLSGTLKDGGAFADVPVTSLNCYGTNHRIPRVTSDISIDFDFRARCFVRFCCIFTVNPTFTFVRITNPLTVNLATNIITNCCLIFDTSVSTTISLQTVKCDDGSAPNLLFRRWEDSLGNTLSEAASTSLILGNINANAAWIRAVWNDCEGGGASGS
jgi:hypothetical protein